MTITRTQTGSHVFVDETSNVPHYAKQDKDLTISLTDFAFEPMATVTLDEEPPRTVFVVEVLGHEYQLPSDIFDSVQRFTHWANSVNLGWSGTQRDLQGILYLLRIAQVPEWDGTTLVELHGNCFVLPERTIGASGSLVYVEHPFGNPWKGATSLKPTERSPLTEMWPEHLHDLARLHKSSVMTPILGWVAAAPLRSRCTKFPVLAISGYSGWGKTTIMETVLKAFGFWMKEVPFLPGLTPHAVVAAATTNNAFPQFFDEYRDSINPLTFAMTENVLRAAWDGNTVAKGGTDQSNVMIVKEFPVRAPIVVTGEESFTQTSHSERMVTIDLPKEGRNFEALDRLVNRDGLAELQGFGRSYLDWLLASVDEDVKQPPNIISDRPAQCEAIAQWGYSMLARFSKRTAMLMTCSRRSTTTAHDAHK